MRSRFINIRVVTPGAILDRDLLVAGDGTIQGLLERDAPTPAETSTIDAQNTLAFPGMIDLLTHGYGRYHYADAESDVLTATSKQLPRHGVTAYAPSITSKPLDELCALLAAMAELPTGGGARVLGIHSEGPCLAFPGAHLANRLAKPSADLARRMVDAAVGRLKFVTLAPELPGADDFMAELRKHGVGLHLGHARTPPEMVSELFDRGITAVTHMFDVMFNGEVVTRGVYPLSLAQALLAEERLYLGLICDGVHAHPIQVKLLAHLAADRVFLETDSMKFTGLPCGRFELEPDHWVRTTPDRGARLDNDGLAGSTLTSDAGLRNFVAMGETDLPRASVAASLNPARLAGMDDRLGSLEPGKAADFVLLDESLTVQATYVDGRCVYTRQPGATPA